MTDLAWLPYESDWRAKLKALIAAGDVSWDRLVELARSRLDFVKTNALDSVLAASKVAPPMGSKPVRLAILGSSTQAHLHAGIRIGGLRRGISVTTYEGDYGQYWQELSDPGSALHEFRPNAVLLALDAHHLAASVNALMTQAETAQALTEMLDRISTCWRLARDTFNCPVIHQTALPVHPLLLGENEHRLAGSKAAFITQLNAALRPLADGAGVDLLALDDRSVHDGIRAWHDPALWHRSKQEVSPVAAPLYGDLIGRLLAAKQGRSYKCLVLDLDNTLWGGVIGDDGLAGIALGQGSALGEAYVAFQAYTRELARRGVILAVCSKNDEANALEPFEKHPDMILRRSDIACFVANWDDKVTNIRAIAEELNIGLESLVFVDDNPFERSLVRQALPLVAVPEIGEDPTAYAQTIADAGYFESLAVTREDRERTGQYQGNRLREKMKNSATDLPSYLSGLKMELVWSRFDKIGLPRIVQLINKTNQFNLTTRRHTEEDVLAVMADPLAFGLQLRLIDRFGDNGIISIIIGKMLDESDLGIDTWLMSCRVLGRNVEQATLRLVAEQARWLGARRLVGEYIPTSKNGMVKGHYSKLGFTVKELESGASRAVLDLHYFTPLANFIEIRQG